MSTTSVAVVGDKCRCRPGLRLAGKDIQINYKMLSPSLTSLVLPNGTATRDPGDEYLATEVGTIYMAVGGVNQAMTLDS